MNLFAWFIHLNHPDFRSKNSSEKLKLSPKQFSENSISENFLKPWTSTFIYTFSIFHNQHYNLMFFW